MSKLISLGCSLTHQDSWAHYLASKYNKSLVNLGQAAGSNEHQVLKFRDYVLEQDISPDDWIIWQITYGDRVQCRKITKPPKQCFEYQDWPRVIENKNFFDQNPRYDLLTPEVIPHEFLVNYDRLEAQSNLLFSIISASKFTKNILVFNAISDAIPFYQRFRSTLDRYNICSVGTALLDYVRHNNLPMADSTHPTVGSYEIYAEKILMPEIESMGWK